MKKNKNGFTLAELLVAVALIGILTAVSVVIFTGHIAKSKETVCRNEKETMKHGTVIISMTERIDWKAVYGSGGLNTPGSEQIISYLLNEGYIEEFKCQSGGTIYAASVEKDMVEFKCTYHDDGMEPGEEGESNKAAKDLADAVNKFAQNKYGEGTVSSNTPTIQEFLKDEENLKYIKKEKISSILTDTVIDQIVSQMEAIKKEKGEAFDKEKYKKSLLNLRDESLVLVPYFVPNTKETITYYITESDYDGKFNSTKQCHAATSILCYNGQWYFCTKTDTNGTKASSDWIPSGFNTVKDIQAHLEGLVQSKTIIKI